MKEIILTNPKPLFHGPSELAVFWSAKAGCTFILRWFLYQVGFLEAALYYHGWLHNYRQTVLEQSMSYLNGVNKIGAQEINIIKLVRNPYSRAVSSYIHAIKAGYEDRKIAHFLNREVNSQKKFSFREFLRYLEDIDLRNCNIHHRLQIHPCEEKGLIDPTFTVKLENSAEEIKKIEVELSMIPSNTEDLRRKSYGASLKYGVGTFESVCDNQFKKGDVFPFAHQFFDAECRRLCARIYEIDFKRYMYDIDRIPLG